MKKSTKLITLSISILILTIIACAVPAPDYATTQTPRPPTPTALSLTLVPNDCIEFTEVSVFYESSTTDSVKYLADTSIPKGSKFIYMGSQVGDRLFVSYGDREGWVLSNYVKPCE